MPLLIKEIISLKKKSKEQLEKIVKENPKLGGILREEEKKEQGLSLADKNKEEVRSGPDQSHP